MLQVDNIYVRKWDVEAPSIVQLAYANKNFPKCKIQ